jgi:serine/threonine protein kinase
MNFLLRLSSVLLAKPHVGESVHVKLCDFGVARLLSRSKGKIEAEGSSCGSVSDGEASPLTPRSRSFSTVGSDYYAAPELAFGGRYDTSVDIYSLGVTLYVLLCGFPPVFSNFAACDSDDSDFDDLKIAHGEVLFPVAYWRNISDNAKGLLRAMLHPEPSLRITAREALQDAWIRDGACAQVQLRSIEAEANQLTQSPLVDLDIVRHELYKTLGKLQSPASVDPLLSFAATGRATETNTKVRNGQSVTRPRKRARHRRGQVERRASATALMALADLYRGVAAPLAAAAAVAAVGTETATSLIPSPVHDESAPQGSFSASQVAALSF